LAEPVSCEHDIIPSCCRLESISEVSSVPGRREYKPPDFEFWHALNCLVHGIRIISTDYTVTFANDAFAGMAGTSVHEIVGRKCWGTFASSFCHTDGCILNRISRGESSVNYESRRTRPNGTGVYCRVSAFPLYSPEGQLIGIMESFRDTTRRRELQEQLDETEDRYRALVELGAEVGESILMLQDSPGREGIITFVSDQFCLMSGYSRQEIIGRPAFDFLAAEDRLSSLERHRAKMSGQSMPGLFEVTFTRKDGTTVPAELTSAVTQYKGKPANVIYLRDITSRKALEKALSSQRDKYQSLFEQAPTAIWEMDYSGVKQCIDSLLARGITDLKVYFDTHPDRALECLNLSRIIAVNRAALSLWEADSREAMCSGILSLLGTRPTGLARELDNIVAFARGSREVVYDIADPTFKGNWKHLHARYHLLPGHDDDWSRVLASFTDITLQKQAETQLKEYHSLLEETVSQRTGELNRASRALALEVEWRKQAQKKVRSLYKQEKRLRSELEHKIQQRIEFTRALVHELKTPLTPLLASCETLAARTADSSLRRMADTILAGGLAINQRIDELIDVAKGEIGMLEMEQENCDLAGIAGAVSDFMRAAFESKRQVLSVDIPPGPIPVFVDEKRIRQVMVNLLDNAYKYTPRGGRVRLKVYSAGSSAVVEVSDNGMGLSPQTLEELFTPYYAPPCKAGPSNGMGLGLALCRMLVDLHGGSIWANSDGQGSIFCFSIPCRDSASENPDN